MRKLQTWAACLIGLAILAVWGAGFRHRAASGVNDFLQLYAGAKLVGTPLLYDVDASRRVQFQAAGVSLDGVYYTRLPFYALLLKPLAALPYITAYWIYQCASVSIVGLFLWRFARRIPETAILACMSPALLINFVNGQDAGMTAAAVGFAYLLRLGNRPFSAGLALTLGAIKFHLLVLTPLALVMRREWRMLQGAAAGAAVLYALSAAAAGFDWPVRFLEAIGNPALHPAPWRMPTLRNLVWILCGEENLALEVALSAAVAGAVGLAAWRARTLASALGLALIGGLLVCHHAYVHDQTMLIPATALLIHGGAPKPARMLAPMVSLPPVAFFVIAGQPFSGIATVGLVLTVLSGIDLWPRAHSASRDTESIPVGA